MTRTQIVKFRGPYDMHPVDIDGEPDTYSVEVEEGYEETFALVEFERDGPSRKVIAFLADIEEPIELKAIQRSSGVVAARNDSAALRTRLTYNLENEAAIVDPPAELDPASRKFRIPDHTLPAAGHLVVSSATGLGFRQHAYLST